MRKLLYISLLLSFSLSFTAKSQSELFGTISQSSSNEKVPFAKISLQSEKTYYAFSDEFGRYIFENIKEGQYRLKVKSIGYATYVEDINVKKGQNQVNVGIKDSTKLKKVEVHAENEFSSRNMRTVEGMMLTHSKKTQQIEMKKVVGNTSNNNARELYSSVPGLNIWESDGGGLQLGIGARGLSPNRTAHFNVRQNGYDISADALGYPESYYTPPAEAIKSIQMIRGAASLQFGPQFGGMLNFNLIEPSKKKFAYHGEHTYGGYNYVGTFNSISGTIKKRFSYLAYYKYKQGDGWRDNSGFSQHNAFGQLKYHFTDRMFLSAEYTHMSYLAQQAGGLTDVLFEQNPRQSIRERNWFAVDWNLFSAHFNWLYGKRSAVDVKFFKVMASRNALGNLDKISRLDDYEERDLIKGDFNNMGAEIRMMNHYPIGKKTKGTIVSGLRYYQGTTSSKQGLSDNGYDANFEFLNPDNLEGSDYVFPSTNYSAFIENMLRLNDKFWVSAGVRYEYIYTSAKGSYRVQNFHPLTNEILFDTTYNENDAKGRHIVLAGVGVTWKVFKTSELYGNIAQNYRGINFSDIRINNPNQQVDPNIQDETGFNADLGFRGNGKRYAFDVSGFFLHYDNKIGVINKKISDYDFVRYRTNIGKAYSSGIEAFGEYMFKRNDSSKVFFSAFANLSYVYARYGETIEEQAYSGNKVELVPPFSTRVGLKLYAGKFTASYLFSYVHEQFSDGTNAVYDPNAVVGLIPSYYVMDVGATYRLNKFFAFKAGVNNVTNNMYFTRRSTGYPGPGIIPSDGINFYVTLDLSL